MKRFVLLFAALVMASCTDNISANHYESGTTGKASATYYGTVLNARRINVSSTKQNTAGTLAGGAAGAVAGSTIGKGTTATLLGGIGGAVIGGIAGNKTQEMLSSQDGFEFIVKLDNGRIVTVAQGSDVIMTPGDRCIVIMGAQSRVIPAN